MAETSTIEWTDATWNPITGCTAVDDGNQPAAVPRRARSLTNPGAAGNPRTSLLDLPPALATPSSGAFLERRLHMTARAPQTAR